MSCENKPEIEVSQRSVGPSSQGKAKHRFREPRVEQAGEYVVSLRNLEHCARKRARQTRRWPSGTSSRCEPWKRCGRTLAVWRLADGSVSIFVLVGLFLTQFDPVRCCRRAVVAVRVRDGALAERVRDIRASRSSWGVVGRAHLLCVSWTSLNLRRASSESGRGKVAALFLRAKEPVRVSLEFAAKMCAQCSVQYFHRRRTPRTKCW
jgi:hypothetical protein